MSFTSSSTLNDLQNFLFIRHSINIYQDPSTCGYVLEKVLRSGDISRPVEVTLYGEDLLRYRFEHVIKKYVLELLGQCETVKISTKFFTGVELK